MEQREKRESGCPYRYRIYGSVVESSAELTSVAETADLQASPLVVLLFKESGSLKKVVGSLATEPGDWVHHHILEDGSVYIHVDGLFEAVVSRDGRTASCACLGTTGIRDVEAHLLNLVLATSLVLQGEEPLHATVVETEGRTIGFLGASGAGKSTLAAKLLGQGAELVTDDMLRLIFENDQVFAPPGPHRLKLYPDPAERFLPAAAQRGHVNSVNGKIMVEPAERAPAPRSPRQLSALFWLGHSDNAVGDDISIDRLEGARLAKTILAATMNLRYQQPERLLRQLQFVERLARTLPVYELTYPRRFELMDRVIENIRRHAGHQTFPPR